MLATRTKIARTVTLKKQLTWASMLVELRKQKCERKMQETETLRWGNFCSNQISRYRSNLLIHQNEGILGR